jgi:hypothetical protein
MDSRAPNAKPVEGLEKTLKVEVKAGPHARVFELSPRFREPGKYDAVFYPTVATTYSYRVVGTLNGTPSTSPSRAVRRATWPPRTRASSR